MQSKRISSPIFYCTAFVCLLLSLTQAHSQSGVQRPLEPCQCPVTIDSSFRTRCAYLIVPENRKKKNGKTVKLPFIWVESKNPNKRKDPIISTAGGPGGSSLGWARGATRHTLINDRDCIAFEQRGTRFAIPSLWSPELSDAIKESYRKNLNKDSMVVVGTKRYKKALEARGIDLSGYNTDETVADIHDLIATLKLDSVNLIGGSYSGGLMLAVLQKDPTHIRSMILDSPLPTFVPIDEQEPANFAKALNLVFARAAKDSVTNRLYPNLKQRFEQYFNSIENKQFYISYKEKGTKDSLRIAYTRNELLDYLVNTLSDPSQVKEIPAIITQMITGHHYDYVRSFLDSVFEHNRAPSGMRISVYCADQTAYHSEQILQQQYTVYPYLRGYHINDVYKAMCDCWKVPPICPETKQPFYSNVPVLLADGELDNACNPIYIDMIHQYMPNSQRILCRNGSHMVLSSRLEPLMRSFLANPSQKLVSDIPDVIVY